MRVDNEIHDKPYRPQRTNNRRLTLGRLVVLAMDKTQSVPLFDKKTKKFLGYRYIYHKS